jgi:hypothetical protein
VDERFKSVGGTIEINFSISGINQKQIVFFLNIFLNFILDLHRQRDHGSR